MIKKFTQILSVGLGIMAISGITSCKKTETIRFNYMAVNASPGTQLDFYTMGSLRQAGLQSDSNTYSKYYEVAIGENEAFTAALKDAAGRELAKLSNPITRDGNFYSLWAIDTGSKVQRLLLSDDLTAPESGKAKLRFIHTGADVPQVDVLINGVEVFSDRFFIGTEIQSGAREFKSVTAADGAAISARLPTGTIVPLGNFDLKADKIYTSYIKGLVSDTTMALEVFENKK
jgi:hypothetical protein